MFLRSTKLKTQTTHSKMRGVFARASGKRGCFSDCLSLNSAYSVSAMSFETNRRNFLRGAMATSAVLLAARTRAFALDPERHFAPVKVSRDRVIREVVGLRPYRDEGFVVDAERLGHKFLV